MNENVTQVNVSHTGRNGFDYFQTSCRGDAIHYSRRLLLEQVVLFSSVVYISVV
jgi:hypothetical protein